MTIDQVIDRVKTLIREWAAAETGLLFIEAEQGKVRPPAPYGTYKFVNPSIRVGSIDELRPDGDEFTQSGLRTALVSVNIMGNGANNLMARLRDSLDRPDIVDLFAEAEVAHIGETGPNDLTALLETGYQERSQMDIDISYAVEYLTTVEPIEEVEVEVENTGQVIVIED